MMVYMCAASFFLLLLPLDIRDILVSVILTSFHNANIRQLQLRW